MVIQIGDLYTIHAAPDGTTLFLDEVWMGRKVRVVSKAAPNVMVTLNGGQEVWLVECSHPSTPIDCDDLLCNFYARTDMLTPIGGPW